MVIISQYVTIYFLCFFTYLSSVCECKRILALLPHTGKSHFEAFRPYLEELSDRGHNVTVVSFFPQTQPPFKYRDISLEGLMTVSFNSVPFSQVLNNPYPESLQTFLSLDYLAQWGLEHCEKILPSPQIQELLTQTGEYDFAITEQFNTDCFLGVVYKLQIPFIALSSCVPLPWSSYRSGFAEHPAFTPSVFGYFSDQLTFGERVENTIFLSFTAMVYSFLYTKPADKLIQKYIGNDVPPLNEILDKTGIVLTNTHFALNGPKLLPPNTIEVGGMHLKPVKPLPLNLQKFADESKDGLILFTFGSMMNPTTLPDETVNAFLNTFNNLKPIRFLWKFDRNLTNVPENVMIHSWLPQRDLLVHPNVRAFMTHGGLLGMLEAAYSGKPLVAIPLFGDQFHNVACAVRQKIAVQLSINNITQKSIENALSTVLTKEYQSRSKSLSEILGNQLRSPIDTAVFWTEHVMEHGSEHFRLQSLKLNWAQYFLLDVFSVIFLVITLISYSILRIFQYFKKNSRPITDSKKNK